MAESVLPDNHKSDNISEAMDLLSQHSAAMSSVNNNNNNNSNSNKNNTKDNSNALISMYNGDDMSCSSRIWCQGSVGSLISSINDDDDNCNDCCSIMSCLSFDGEDDSEQKRIVDGTSITNVIDIETLLLQQQRQQQHQQETTTCIENIEPVKIEAMLRQKKRHVAASSNFNPMPTSHPPNHPRQQQQQQRQQQQKQQHILLQQHQYQLYHQLHMGVTATVVSASCCSQIPSSCCCFDDDDWESAVDLVVDIGYQEELISPLKKKLKPSNPFEVLADELICSIFSFLNVTSLVQARLVSTQFKELGSRNDAGWESSCNVKWKDKVNICWKAIQLKNSLRAMEAFDTSCHDGKFRHEITPNELCYDPITGRGTVWYFRFKESAGPAWTTFDPWYAGDPARKMVFLRDGTVWQLLTPDDDDDGEEDTNNNDVDDREVNENYNGNADNNEDEIMQRNNYQDLQEQNMNADRSSRRLQPAFFDGLAVPPNQQQHHHQHRLSRIEMKWRFVLQPMDLPKRPRGSYVRLNVGGRDVPTYVMKRSPTGNWGFVMENCWGVFASFPLSPKEQPHDPSLHQQRQRPRMRLRRTSTGAGLWLNVAGFESDSDDDDEEDAQNILRHNHNLDQQEQQQQEQLGARQEQQRQQHEQQQNHVVSTLDDSVLTITNRTQWREALLYNYGATTLPEGDSATAEFDRVFRSLRVPRPPAGMHNFMR